MQSEVFQRHKQNPIITADDMPYDVNSVFNPAAIKLDSETLLMMRVEDRRGISHLTAARSIDGVSDWKIEPKPTLYPVPETYPEEMWGVEDPRITHLEELNLWAMTYTSFSKRGPLVSMATTEDFKSFKRLGAIMPPENKDAAMFSVRIKDRWAILHRPLISLAGVSGGIWISFSPDLRHWGDHRLLMLPRKAEWWDAKKIGLGPPPIETPEGWLILYHGVRVTVSGSIYRLGLALLDLDDPTKIVCRADDWVFGPQESYERIGDVNNVVFPCGWVVDDDEVRIYYGGADSCIGMASTKLSDLIAFVKQ